jgi:hypothetical protein
LPVGWIFSNNKPLYKALDGGFKEGLLALGVLGTCIMFELMPLQVAFYIPDNL